LPLYPSSFPTRRSSDLEGRQARRGQRQQHTCGNAPDVATAIGFQTRSEVVKHQTKGLWYIAAFLLYQLKLVFEGSRFAWRVHRLDRKSTRLNSSHEWIS